MAFQQGLSGLNSASRNLDVIGHNIANANTVGMKASRAEFAELYASSINAVGGVNAGIGVSVATVFSSITTISRVYGSKDGMSLASMFSFSPRPRTSGLALRAATIFSFSFFDMTTRAKAPRRRWATAASGSAAPA